MLFGYYDVYEIRPGGDQVDYCYSNTPWFGHGKYFWEPWRENSSAMERKSEAVDGVTFFLSAIISACFQELGKILWAKEELKMFVI